MKIVISNNEEVGGNMDVHDSLIKNASDMILKVMKIVPKGESKSLYELAKESAEEFISRKRYDGKQDMILLDSILSIGRRYKLVVEWVDHYDKYTKTRGFEHSLETLAKLDLSDYKKYLQSIGVSKIPNQSRVEFAIEFAKLFLQKYPKISDKYGLFRWVEESEGWTQFLKDYDERDEICRSFTDFMLKEYNRPLPEGRTLIGLSVFQYLRMLSEPLTVYDVIKLGYAHSTAYKTLQEYLRYGIIEKVGSEPLKSGLVKKYYQLSEIGLSLLHVLEKLGENCRHVGKTKFHWAKR